MTKYMIFLILYHKLFTIIVLLSCLSMLINATQQKQARQNNQLHQQTQCNTNSTNTSKKQQYLTYQPESKSLLYLQIALQQQNLLQLIINKYKSRQRLYNNIQLFPQIPMQQNISKSHHPHSHIPTFIKKLQSILNNDKNNQLIKWLNNGQGFIIINNQKFIKNILPKYFRHSKLNSFIRQLNMYGFKKIKQLDTQYYMHPYFLKSHPQHYNKIHRKPQKKNNSQPKALKIKSQKYLMSLQQIQKKINKKITHFQSIANIYKQSVQCCHVSINNIANRQDCQGDYFRNLLDKTLNNINIKYDIQDTISICSNLQDKCQLFN